jgi:hypothetical protein
MKKIQYEIYVHICQNTGYVCYAKCNCKCGAGGCCKHVAATLYQLVEYKQLNLKSVPEEKACTDVLQKWHIPGELAKNCEAVLFSDLTFEKADANKDINNLRCRPFVTGKLSFCATPLSGKNITLEKLQQFTENFIKLNQGVTMAELIVGNNFEQSNFYETSINELAPENEKHVENVRVVIMDKFLRRLDHSI